MRYNQNYQCKSCNREATEEYVDLGLDCPCGGRVWVKTHKHRLAVTVDDERFMESKVGWFDDKVAKVTWTPK